MIVVCPSCQQRYRHTPENGGTATLAHCSACDERFPLERQKRAYLVVDAAPHASAGLSDPLAGPAPASIDMPPTGEGVTVPAQADPAASEATTPAARRPGTGARPGRKLLEGMVALLPCGLGAGLAYHLAGPRGQDPITWAALGGAVGLLMGWACLLWITRGD